MREMSRKRIKGSERGKKGRRKRVRERCEFRAPLCKLKPMPGPDSEFQEEKIEGLRILTQYFLKGSPWP